MFGDRTRKSWDRAMAWNQAHPMVRLVTETRAALVGQPLEAEALSATAQAAMLDLEPPTKMADDALQSVFDKIDTLDAKGGHNSREAVLYAGAGVQEILDLPEPVRDLAFESVLAGGWQYCLPGLKRMELMQHGGMTAELLRIEPGCGAPRHTHDGHEFTLVMQGAFKDSDNTVYRRGDICMAGPEKTHKPVAEPGPVCLALALTDAPLAFTGLLGFIQKALNVN